MSATKEFYHDEIVAGQMAAKKTYTREQLVFAYQKWVDNWKDNPAAFVDWDKVTNSEKDAEESVDYMLSLIAKK